MFTKRDIYLSLDISEIRAIVNLNLSQNHTVVNRLYTKVFRKSYKSVGHIHFYSYTTANLMLELTGYEIIHQRFAKNRTKNIFQNPTFKNIFTAIPQFIIETINPYFSSVIMGDHLVVFAKRKANRDMTSH